VASRIRVESPRAPPRSRAALVAASVAPASAGPVPVPFVVDAWTQETCAAYSFSQDFDITGCHTGAGITPDTDTKSDASPGDSSAAIGPSADVTASASLPGSLDHNSAAAYVFDAADSLSAAASSAVLTLTLRNASASPAPLDFGIEIDSGLLRLELKDFEAEGDDIPIADVTAEIWCDTCVQKLAWHYRALYASYDNENQFGVVNDLLDFYDPYGVPTPNEPT